MNHLYYTAKFTFKSYYEIFNDNEYTNKIGEIKESSWLTETKAELNQSKYLFINNGIYLNKTNIFKLNKENYKNEKIGEITYNFWKSKANIELYKQKYNFQYTNNWNTKFEVISDIDKSKLLGGESKSLKGRVDILPKNAELSDKLTFENDEISISQIQEILALSLIYTNNMIIYYMLILIIMVISFVNIVT
ncbi:MAG: hypothetical protein ACOVNU_10835 [Candidatus Kapaibacteriota bacterium]|jgi:hypothetical protein